MERKRWRERVVKNEQRILAIIEETGYAIPSPRKPPKPGTTAAKRYLQAVWVRRAHLFDLQDICWRYGLTMHVLLPVLIEYWRKQHGTGAARQSQARQHRLDRKRGRALGIGLNQLAALLANDTSDAVAQRTAREMGVLQTAAERTEVEKARRQERQVHDVLRDLPDPLDDLEAYRAAIETARPKVQAAIRQARAYRILPDRE